MTDREQFIREAIEESETIRDTPPPTEAKGGRKNRAASSVYSFRLPNDVIAELNDLATKLDVPVSALIRGFVLDGLTARKGGDLRSALDRLEARRRGGPAQGTYCLRRSDGILQSKGRIGDQHRHRSQLRERDGLPSRAVWTYIGRTDPVEADDAYDRDPPAWPALGASHDR